MRKLYLFVSACMFAFFVGCGSDDGTSNESKIIGTWEEYLSFYEGFEEGIPVEPGQVTLEFKTNGTLLLTERGYLSIMSYSIDDDILDTKKENGEQGRVYRVLQLDGKELRLDFLDGRKRYLKKIK